MNDNTVNKDDDWKPITDLEENFELYSAISDPKSNTPVDISDVIAKLAKTETLEEGESICYIGCGNFAVVRLGSENDDFEIKRVIEYETQTERAEWRSELKFRMNNQAQPSPQILRSLYSAEQIKDMPKFN